MKIKEIVKKLQWCDPKLPIVFDFVGCYPTTIESWRGIYADPAIGWSHDRLDKYNCPTVEQFLEEIYKATETDKRYQGWKGGWYQFNSEQELMVDNPGQYTLTRIVGVDVNGYQATLITQRDED